MKTPLVVLLVSVLAVTGCDRARESRMNPRNWFGSSEEERPSLGPVGETEDNRAPVAQVSALTTEQTSSGALIRAEAIMPTAGWWDAELVPENYGRPQAGVLTLRFVAAEPRETAPDTGVQSRTLVAVYSMSQAQLDVVSEIVVTGEGNSRRIRR